MEELLLIGAGGHARVLLDALALAGKFHLAGVIGVESEVGRDVLGIPVVGTLADVQKFVERGVTHAAIGIGSVGDTSQRVAAAEVLQRYGLVMPVVMHPAAVVSPLATVHAGAFVAAGAVIGVGADIGMYAIVNSGAVVDHDCVIGDFAHISPGVSLSGGVSVGEHTHVGTGSSVIQSVTIGSDVLLGAGSVVVRDIEPGVVAYGNPARPVMRRS